MFPPALRADRQQIEQVMKYGKKVSGAYGYLRYVNAEKTSMAVIVPKKVDKRSSKRNLLKRRLRTIMIQLAQESPQKVSFAYYCTAPASFAELQNELTSLWNKLA